MWMPPSSRPLNSLSSSKSLPTIEEWAAENDEMSVLSGRATARAINRLCPALSAVTNLSLSLRSFSSAKQFNSVKILYGSQTGTAQLFAIQLADEISDIADDISCAAIDSAASPSEVVSTPDSANIFITSVAGVGEIYRNRSFLLPYGSVDLASFFYRYSFLTSFMCLFRNFFFR